MVRRSSLSLLAPSSLQKIIAIGVLPENLPALDASNDNVMQRSRPI